MSRIAAGMLGLVLLLTAADCDQKRSGDRSCSSAIVPDCPGMLVPKCNAGRWECVDS